MKLVLASNNAKKLKELNALFAPLALEIVTQGSLGVAEAEEPHITFVENALAKARHAAAATGLPVIADDSGLCVDALGGHPGVQSAVYAPLPPQAVALADREARRAAQDEANNTLLLQRLAEAPGAAGGRQAAFVCALVALRAADDPEPLIAFGRWPGEILATRRGAGGFGYDPLMYIPALGATAAELPAEVKNAHSHRALAAAQMLALMRSAWRLG
ncbi:non-canonical purine NTP pyrophosphatase [Ideonella livida]|uniref:dITP/XTP pyrophosphatase n=1 Tax=Ideonella livida TaxID=2707176 RepID=A0A7C9TMA2_9BURK|nr:non-canonical purine NTP pyrophosphatase [Ideonella livida]NDY91526.1 non-canonical purine NTP pyrophosphatase [Ideonella livida]